MIEVPRPKAHLIAAARRYPGAWRQVDEFRAGRGKDLPDWPEWCFLPFAGWHAIVSTQAGAPTFQTQPFQFIIDVGTLAALGTWRLTQGIYRFDPTLYAALVDTPITGDLPCELFYRLPEWCVYIETPGLRWLESELHGFFSHLEWDTNDGRTELRLVLDTENELLPMPLHLGPWSLDEAIARMNREAEKQVRLPLPDAARQMILEYLPALVSLLLYLCSENADLPGERPTNPQPKRTKQGWRLFSAEKTHVWDVGVRIGAALRRAESSESIPGDGTHASPRAHIRRAHWHTYRVGEGRTDRRLKWLPPIAVNADTLDTLPATIHPVRGAP